MRKLLILLLFSFVSLQAGEFSDPITGLTLHVPDGFVLDEEASQTSSDDGKWWYQYIDEDCNEISIEIEAFEEEKTLPEHFHKRMTEEENGKDSVVYEGLEFRNLTVAGRTFTKSRLRILAISDEHVETICMCDYLFVEGQYGFSVNLTAKKDISECEKAVESILRTITFE